MTTGPSRRAIRALEDLRERGFLCDTALCAILKAAHHSTDPHNILAFAAVYRHWISQHREDVLDDTVAMSIQVGRRVRLSWSRRRWEEEHRRLMELTTLDPAAGSTSRNEQFDTIWLEKCLAQSPARPGQIEVLGSRRRLRQESTLQHHCIGSEHYQSRFRRRKLGGVSLLLDASDGPEHSTVTIVDLARAAIPIRSDGLKRWTVTIVPPVVDGAPARIHRIYGKSNVVPDSRTRAQLLRLLGGGIVDTPLYSSTSHQNDRALMSDNNPYARLPPSLSGHLIMLLV